MTDEEFGTWLAFHCDLFPQVGKWAADQGPALEAWQEALEDANASLHDAKSATKAMLKGDTGEAYGVSDHPKILKRWIEKRRLEFEAVEKRHAAKCDTCMDCGWVPVYSERAKREAINGRPIPHDIAAARCGCMKRDPKYGEEDKQKYEVFFHHARMVEYEGYDNENLKRWAEKLKKEDEARRDETGGFAKGELFTGEL